MIFYQRWFVALALCGSVANGFVMHRRSPLVSVERYALWQTTASPDGPQDITAENETNNISYGNTKEALSKTFTGFCLAATLLLSPAVSFAVSGGGLDYAGLDITGENFSNSNYKGKDFTQVIAKGTNFAKSNLQGCRFYKAYLVNADFSDADLRGASLEDTSMDGANLKNAVAVGAYFGASIIDASNLENADFTDAQFPLKTIPLLCEREDLRGTNPSTGANTRDSVMC